MRFNLCRVVEYESWAVSRTVDYKGNGEKVVAGDTRHGHDGGCYMTGLERLSIITCHSSLTLLSLGSSDEVVTMGIIQQSKLKRRKVELQVESEGMSLKEKERYHLTNRGVPGGLP